MYDFMIVNGCKARRNGLGLHHVAKPRSHHVGRTNVLRSKIWCPASNVAGTSRKLEGSNNPREHPQTDRLRSPSRFRFGNRGYILQTVRTSSHCRARNLKDISVSSRRGRSQDRSGLHWEYDVFLGCIFSTAINSIRYAGAWRLSIVAWKTPCQHG